MLNTMPAVALAESADPTESVSIDGISSSEVLPSKNFSKKSPNRILTIISVRITRNRLSRGAISCRSPVFWAGYEENFHIFLISSKLTGLHRHFIGSNARNLGHGIAMLWKSVKKIEKIRQKFQNGQKNPAKIRSKKAQNYGEIILEFFVASFQGHFSTWNSKNFSKLTDNSSICSSTARVRHFCLSFSLRKSMNEKFSPRSWLRGSNQVLSDFFVKKKTTHTH